MSDKERKPVTDAGHMEELIGALATAGGVRPFTEYAIADLRGFIGEIIQERDTLREHAQVDATMLQNCRRERASLELKQPTPPPPSETAVMTDHKHESVGIFSRGPCDAPRVSICACGATQRVGSSTWMVPPNPRSFDTIPPEQRAELLAFSEWLKLPKPKVTFEVYRAEHLPPPSETKLKALLDELDYQEAVAVGQALRYGNPEDGLAQNERSALAISDARKARSAARSSLESLYREQQAEIEQLKMLGKCVEGGMPIVKRYTEAYHELEAELSALRSLQLTQEEADHILAILGSQYEEDCRPGLFGKLRAIVEATNGR